MPRITIACPAASVADANQLAACLGFSMADAETYGPLNWQTADGALYSCASLEVADEWLAKAQQPLVRPAWDVGEQINMAAAVRAQAAMVLLTEPALAATVGLTALVWPVGLDAVKMIGLMAVQ